MRYAAITSTPLRPGSRLAGGGDRGAQALGFTSGQVVQRESYEAVYQQIDPRTGARLGRPCGRHATFAEHLARLRAAEPHAKAERLIELERQAARATRQPAVYIDVTVSFSKSISLLHALPSWWAPHHDAILPPNQRSPHRPRFSS